MGKKEVWIILGVNYYIGSRGRVEIVEGVSNQQNVSEQSRDLFNNRYSLLDSDNRN